MIKTIVSIVALCSSIGFISLNNNNKLVPIIPTEAEALLLTNNAKWLAGSTTTINSTLCVDCYGGGPLSLSIDTGWGDPPIYGCPDYEWLDQAQYEDCLGDWFDYMWDASGAAIDAFRTAQATYTTAWNTLTAAYMQCILVNSPAFCKSERNIACAAANATFQNAVNIAQTTFNLAIWQGSYDFNQCMNGSCTTDSSAPSECGGVNAINPPVFYFLEVPQIVCPFDQSPGDLTACRLALDTAIDSARATGHLAWDTANAQFITDIAQAILKYNAGGNCVSFNSDVVDAEARAAATRETIYNTWYTAKNAAIGAYIACGEATCDE